MSATEDTKRKIVIYFSAGAMAGVFSSGFSKTLEESNIKPYIHSVYGNSCGSFTGLYFLSGQIENAAALYWEDLNDDKYIRMSRLPRYVLSAFCNRIFRTNIRLHPVFDIDMIKDILLSKRKVDFSAVKDSGVDLYMIAYNLTTSHHDYLKLQKEEEVMPFLQATAGGHPAYPHSSLIHGNLYIDGGTIDDERRIARIIERHPDKEIICVLNNPKWKGSKIRNFFSKVGIGLMVVPFFGFKEAFRTANSDFSNVNLLKMQESHPYLHFVANDLTGYQLSTDASKHKMLYKRGQELAKEFLLSGQLKNVVYKLAADGSPVLTAPAVSTTSI